MNFVKTLLICALLSLGFASISTASETTQTQKIAVQKISINTADAITISKTMKGVGMKKAEAIVAFRTANGPFKKIEELLKVKGIGAETLAKNLDKIQI